MAVIVIVNPLASVPFFLAHTRHEAQRTRTALAGFISVAVFLLLLAFLVGGQTILSAFNITLPAFEIAGGILLLSIGLGMILAEKKAPGEISVAEPNADLFDVAASKFSNLLVPMVVPFLVGPGAIGTIILYSHQAEGWPELAAMAVALGAASCVVLVVLLASDWIQVALGRNGIELFIRLFGLFVCSIAVQFMLEGLSQVTVDLINPEFVSPKN
jgi:multiple antibiotic resistance protein